MKKSLDLNKLITLALMLGLMSIYACNPGDQQKKSPKIINISGADPNGELDLRDDSNHSAKTFMVNAGATINWNVNSALVSNIDSIYKKPTTQSDTLFSPAPSRIGTSPSWMANIDPNAHGGQYEDYNIDWTDSSGHQHTFDPRIQINP